MVAELEERVGEVGARGGVREVEDPRAAPGENDAEAERGDDGAAPEAGEQVTEMIADDGTSASRDAADVDPVADLPEIPVGDAGKDLLR